MGKHRHCKHYIQEHEENIRLKRIIGQISAENIELKKRLQYYENYNSPPSANSLLWKKMKRERRADDNNADERKPSRKNGHKGVSHSFKPTERIEHTLDRCNRCGSSNITLSHHDYKTVVDIPKREPYTVTLHKVSIYRCNDCEEEVKPDAGIPKHGMLGKNLLAMIPSLWYARLTVEKIRDYRKLCKYYPAYLHISITLHHLAQTS
ncbi:MAG: hypothetical protein QXU32_12975 [Nitrososphaerales archaeon]